MPEEKSGRKPLSLDLAASQGSDGLYSQRSSVASDSQLLTTSLTAASGWVKCLLAMLYGLTFFFTISGMMLIAPGLETRYWPVVSKMHIDKMEPWGQDKTQIYASFEKLRNCDYLGIGWFWGSRESGFKRVPLVLYRQSGDVSSPNRPVGWQSAGPWIVSIPMSHITTNSFVELYHQCVPFWVTRTRFYP